MLESAGLRYGVTAAISPEPWLEAGVPVHAKKASFSLIVLNAPTKPRPFG